jgi:uncharacterized protein involved in exopolysaccharide biosynthesis
METPPSDSSQTDADLFEGDRARDYLTFVVGSVRRRRKLVATVALWILALTMLSLAAVPRTYRVEATLLAQRNPVLVVRGDGQDATPPIRGATETIKKRDNLVALIEATDLLRHWDEHRAPAQRAVDALRHVLHEESEDERLDDMVDRLGKRLAVWTNEGTVSIAIEWPDATMASLLVGIAQQNFLEARHAQEITALAEAIAIYQGHAERLRASVDDAVASLEKVRTERDAVAVAGTVMGGRVVAPPRAIGRKNQPTPEAEQLQAALHAKRRALEDLEETRRQKLAAAQVHLAEQRATYTDNHPTIIDLKQSVAALEAPSPQVKALREEVAALRGEYERLAGGDARGAPLPSVSVTAAPPRLPPEFFRLDQELRDDKDPAVLHARGQLRDAMEKYAALCEKVQAAQIDLETAEAAFKYRYSVLTPARVPRRPIKPSVPLILSAALVAAVFAAILIAAIADVHAGRLVERWQIERLLNRPILGDVELPRLPAARESRTT